MNQEFPARGKRARHRDDRGPQQFGAAPHRSCWRSFGRTCRSRHCGCRECSRLLRGGIHGEGRGLGEHRRFARLGVARPPFRLGGAAGKSAHFGGKGLHAACLKSQKFVQLAAADGKIGLQQISAAKDKPDQLRTPPNIDAERQRRAKEKEFPQSRQPIAYVLRANWRRRPRIPSRAARQAKPLAGQQRRQDRRPRGTEALPPRSILSAL